MEAIMESQIQQEIQLEAARLDCILLRNNSGALPDRQGREVRFGLGNISKKYSEQMKSSDLIGLKRVVITPDMVGRTLAVFTAVEVKDSDWKYSTSDKRAVAQKNFIEWVLAMGGFAGFAKSVEEFRAILRK